MPHLMRRTDSEIQQDVLRELKWDTRVEETDVGATKGMPGVRNVRDQLRIEPYA